MLLPQLVVLLAAMVNPTQLPSPDRVKEFWDSASAAVEASTVRKLDRIIARLEAEHARLLAAGNADSTKYAAEVKRTLDTARRSRTRYR